MFIDTVSTQLFELLTTFKVSKLMISKYGYLTLPRVLLFKVIPNNDITDAAVTHCKFPVVKMF